ncbi:MAG: efflux RND transporter periplasmic adaptor subunit [Gammaproteobacteria bacterium]
MSGSQKRVLILSSIVAGVVLALLIGIRTWMGYEAAAAMAHRGPMLVSVTTAPVRTMPWTKNIHAVANLVAVSGVELTPQLAGQITAIDFHSGEYVHRGQVLIEIDDSNVRAQLARDRAALTLAEINYRRALRLYKVNATSRSTLDTALANRNSARAVVANDEATLAKLRFQAPFSGWIGVRQVSLGQYLIPGATITSLNVWQPLRVEFTVPQNQVAKIRPGVPITVRVDAYPKHPFGGHIVAVSSRINPATRNLSVDAEIPNRHQWLRPGMFGEVTLEIGHPHPTLVVPSTALTYSTFGDYVYVIHQKKILGHLLPVAIATPVQVGSVRGSITPIRSGLKPGERVVTAGQIKLRSGMPVSIHGTQP